MSALLSSKFCQQKLPTYFEVSNMLEDGIQLETWRRPPFLCGKADTTWIVPGTIQEPPALENVRHVMLHALDSAESILRYAPEFSTNCNGKKPDMTTRRALALVRHAIKLLRVEDAPAQLAEAAE